MDTQADESTKKRVIEVSKFFDIQASMTIIGRRQYSSTADKEYFLNFRRIYLEKLILRELDLKDLPL
jgi:hypothetical protein